LADGENVPPDNSLSKDFASPLGLVGAGASGLRGLSVRGDGFKEKEEEFGSYLAKGRGSVFWYSEKGLVGKLLAKSEGGEMV